MKDLDALLGIDRINIAEKEKQRELRLREHCLEVKAFQSGINLNDIYPTLGEISSNADYTGGLTAQDSDGQKFRFCFRAMKGIAQDPFINSVGELCQTPWFVITLLPKSADENPPAEAYLAVADAFKKRHHFPLTYAIIELIEIITRESS